ncbi:MAG TPA: PQQ-binding-like beta-propeller repeat protein [Pirellulales bacterium]|nr:PQQ-binding-like beta-propeller repeat protein [Pirellulales bacterium]
MGWFCRARWLAAACYALTLAGPVRAQGPAAGRFELSDAIRLDEADAATRTHLEQVRAFLANQQWDEAVETLRQVTESHGGKVIGLTPRRFVSVRDYCHLLVASLPPEALDLYRSRVDAQAERWYRQGVEKRSAAPLLSVVEQLFCSSWGDDALEALGELALEQGDYGTARGYWQRILPPSYWLKCNPALAREDGTPTVLVYPDTNLPLAGIRARLVLLLILEGETDAAEAALEAFAEEFGAAEGRLGGRQVVYADRLEELMTESRQWPRLKTGDDWPTFAGSPTRNKAFSHEVELGSLRWRQPLAPAPAPELSYSVRRVAERKEAMLSYHPLLVEGLVLVSNAEEIRAYDAKTGTAAWADDPLIFASNRPEMGLGRGINARHGSHGAPRFTMTAYNRRLYARMGNPATSGSHDMFGQPPQGYLVCLDLKAQGKLVWDSRRSMPGEEGWTFEGSPVCDGACVYVAMRRSGVQPQAHVACLDAETGRLRWRKLVCSAESPSQNQAEEITHNLLTLDHGTLYYNTNLGAVAALDTRDGQPRWISRYPRVKTIEVNDRAKHLYRDLTPCLYDRGAVYVAPADCRDILALDASTGLLIWSTPHAEDAVHLLGVGGGNLLASGDKLWWIDTVTGKAVRDPFPQQPPPKGFGRGVLAGDAVYWPTQSMIYVFDQKTGKAKSTIELSTRGTDISGGNLLVNGDSLLIATSRELLSFSPHSGLRDGAPPEAARERQEISLHEQGTAEHASRR